MEPDRFDRLATVGGGSGRELARGLLVSAEVVRPQRECVRTGARGR
jgi:hypothetical protein